MVGYADCFECRMQVDSLWRHYEGTLRVLELDVSNAANRFLQHHGVLKLARTHALAKASILAQQPCIELVHLEIFAHKDLVHRLRISGRHE